MRKIILILLFLSNCAWVEEDSNVEIICPRSGVRNMILQANSADVYASVNEQIAARKKHGGAFENYSIIKTRYGSTIDIKGVSPEEILESCTVRDVDRSHMRSYIYR